MTRIQTAAGYSIGCIERGSGTATPIVFLHGVGSDKSVWHPQLDHFGAERRSIAFDYPGYGDSGPAPDGVTRDDYATAILSALTQLGVEKAHICGLSLGGVVAIAIHHAEPDRCSSLVLADTFAAHPEGQAIYDRSLVASADMRALAEGRVDVLLAQPSDPAVRNEVVETMALIEPAAFRIGARAVWLADQEVRAAAIRVPVLILCGTEDRVTPPALSQELASIIKGARYAAIGNAGHLTNLEQPDAFNRIVEEFILPLD